MSKPYIHATASVRRYGGKPEDYLAIHQHMDSTKGAFPDNRHRVVTHNSWYIGPNGPLELIFGVNIINSDGRKVSVRSIGEDHILEDFGMKFIPSLGDYIENMSYEEWMTAGKGKPPSSHKKLENKKIREILLD